METDDARAVTFFDYASALYVYPEPELIRHGNLMEITLFEHCWKRFYSVNPSTWTIAQEKQQTRKEKKRTYTEMTRKSV